MGARGDRNPEAVGLLLSLAFVLLASVRDVYLGGRVQHVSPLAVAVSAFSVCTLAFLAVALVRDRAGLARLVRHPRRLGWVNATTALAWLSFLFALRIAEPALVQILFFGVGPLSLTWIDRWAAVATPAPLAPGERRLRLGLLVCLGLAATVAAGGLSGLGAQPPGRALLGVALALGGGVAIAASTSLCRALNDAGVRPATLLSLRFPGAAVLAAALAVLSGEDGLHALTPGGLAGIALPSSLLIVLPNYVNQVGVALASPVTVRAVLALGPVVVFLLQLVEGRLPSSPATLGACLLYGAFALAAAIARQRAIGPLTAGRGAPRASSRCPC
jgi:drug/metabolite transporter (DMT)-like permease